MLHFCKGIKFSENRKCTPQNEYFVIYLPYILIWLLETLEIIAIIQLIFIFSLLLLCIAIHLHGSLHNSTSLETGLAQTTYLEE